MYFVIYKISYLKKNLYKNILTFHVIAYYVTFKCLFDVILYNRLCTYIRMNINLNHTLNVYKKIKYYEIRK